jgi:hypothetical protein
MEQLTPYQKVLLQHAMDRHLAECREGPQSGPNIIPAKLWEHEFENIKRKLEIK